MLLMVMQRYGNRTRKIVVSQERMDFSVGWCTQLNVLHVVGFLQDHAIADVPLIDCSGD